jgi:hypothetical protein
MPPTTAETVFYDCLPLLPSQPVRPTDRPSIKLFGRQVTFCFSLPSQLDSAFEQQGVGGLSFPVAQVVVKSHFFY